MTIKVKGYTKKDGTKVKGYTKSKSKHKSTGRNRWVEGRLKQMSKAEREAFARRRAKTKRRPGKK